MLIEDISTSALASSLAGLTVSGEPPAADALLLTVQTAEGGGSGLLLKISARMHTEQTALVYDERMCAHECPTGHPERPERIVELHRELHRLGFAEHCTRVPSRQASSSSRCSPFPLPNARPQHARELPRLAHKLAAGKHHIASEYQV